MSKKTVLIVGGAGFIGSYVDKFLYQRGYHTLVLDNLSKGDRNAVKYGQFINGDMGDAETLQALFKTYTIDCVMHFAAFINVGESVKLPELFYQNNVLNTLQLLKIMLKNGVNKLIFSSSAAIFGNSLINKIKEDHPCNPINPYGRTKWMVEQVLKDFAAAYGLKYCALRYFNAAGGDPEGIIKHKNSSSENLIPAALRSLLQPNQSLTIYGTDYETPDGTCIRDYIHIDDLARAHLSAMEKLLEGEGENCYNLGNGQGYSVREVISAINKVTGRKLKVLEGNRRAGDPPILLADSQKASRELGWQPKYPDLESMILHAWKVMYD